MLSCPLPRELSRRVASRRVESRRGDLDVTGARPVLGKGREEGADEREQRGRRERVVWRGVRVGSGDGRASEDEAEGMGMGRRKKAMP